MKKRILALCSLLAVTYAGTSFATQWDMATPYPDSSFQTLNDYQFARDISNATDGNLQLTVRSDAYPIRHPQIVHAVRTGKVQAGEILMSIMGQDNPLFSIDSVPFLATTYKQARVLWDVSRAPIARLMADKGLKLLYTVPWPPQGLYTNRKINSVEDLKGLKFRVYNGMTRRLASLTGMAAIQVEVPELEQAFKKGTIDAMITSPATGVNIHAWDYTKYYYQTNAWLPKNMVFVNRKAFNALDEDTQQAVLNAAARAGQRGWKTSRERTKTLVNKLASHGIRVIQPSPKLENGLQKVGQQLIQHWIDDEAGPSEQKVIDQYNAKILAVTEHENGDTSD